jgi:hypothetical protein
MKPNSTPDDHHRVSHQHVDLVEQLAEIYGVSVGEIERIVGAAVDGDGSTTLAAD